MTTRVLNPDLKYCLRGRVWSTDIFYFIKDIQELSYLRCNLIGFTFAFLDGAHGYEDVMFEFSQIRDKQKSGDIIIYDDYNKVQFPGLVRAVDEICLKHSYSRVDINTESDRAYVIAVKI